MIRRIVFFMYLIFPVAFISCDSSENLPIVVDFDNNTKTSENQISNDSLKPINVAVAAMISPKETFSYYEELFEYISGKTGRNIVFKQRKTYQEINEMLASNEVDIAFVCSGAYIENVKNTYLLVAPVCNGLPYYQAYIIVHKSSDIENFEDLRNKSFAFTDPLSNTGKLYAEKRVKEMNDNTKNFFSSLLYSNAHDISIQLVSKHIVDGATIDGLIYEYLKTNSPERVEDIKIIEKSEYYGIPPVVSSREIDMKLMKQIKDVMITMHLDEKGHEILNKIMVDKFQEVGDTLYNSVRDVKNFVCN